MTASRIIQNTFKRFCAIGAGACMAAIFLIIFINSLRRYTTGKSFEWGEELPVYLSLYGVMFGIAYAYLQDRHIAFTVFTDLLPERVREGLQIFVDAVMIAAGGMMAYSGWLFLMKRGEVEASGLIGSIKKLVALTDAPWLLIFGHMAAWQFAMTAGGIILAFAACLKLYERIQAFRDGGH